VVYFEAAPGDLLFFHANTLHASAEHQQTPLSLICCYNTRENRSKGHHHRYTRW